MKIKENKTFINAGIYILNSNIKSFFNSEKFCHMTDFIQSAILKKKEYIFFQYMKIGMIISLHFLVERTVKL